jgi:ankyrin repeat protein
VKVLVEHGALIDKARKCDGTSPLFMATQNGHLEIVKVLINHGAVIDKSTTDDGTTHYGSTKWTFGDCEGVGWTWC